MVKKKEYANTGAYVLDAFADIILIDARITRIPEAEA